MKRAFVSAGLLVMVGCAAAPTPPAAAPTAATPAPTNAAPAAPKDDPWALPREGREPLGALSAVRDVPTAKWAKASKAKGIGPVPPACAALEKPKAPKAAAADLGAAVAEPDPTERNAKLAQLEASKTDQALRIRVVRAELGPAECADVLLDPMLASKSVVTDAVGQRAIGLSLAAKLARTAIAAPAIKDASDKEKVKRFIQGPLREWMVEQASAIEALSVPAGDLTALARGVVAVEAGTADLRLVDRIRSSPTPSAWDKELKAVYEAALDEALEPRKARGRDAALVGLADFAEAKILHDARIDRARGLLSKLYGGRRIDALDGLLLPPLPTKASTVPETVATLLPDATVPERTARERLELGRTYWRRVDFVEAAHAAAKEGTAEGRLMLAVSLALAKGPKNAKEMMSAASASALGLGNTDALDALAAEHSPVAGMAAFDAAHLRSLSAPDGAAAGPWFTDVAARFERAAGLLEDPALAKRAKERAATAEATAKAIGAK